MSLLRVVVGPAKLPQEAELYSCSVILKQGAKRRLNVVAECPRRSKGCKSLWSRERYRESAMTQQWTQIGLIGFRLLFHGRTKKLDAESPICYDSARKAVVFCGKG